MLGHTKSRGMEEIDIYLDKQANSSVVSIEKYVILFSLFATERNKERRHTKMIKDDHQ